MGLQPRSGGDHGESGAYVSTITAEELGRYTSAEYADGYPSDAEEDDTAGEGKQDKPSFADKISNAVKNFSLPSPEDIKNSNFVKSFHQPLIVKSKVQKPKVLEANQMLAAEKTPSELSKISKLSEFPLPSIKFGGGEKDGDGGSKAELGGDDESAAGGGFDYNTLTRSLRETKLITTITECDPEDEELIKKMEITKSMTPAQLAEIKSIKDIPIPDVVKHLLDKPAAKPASAAVTNGHSEVDGEETAKNTFLTTKLVTNIKECTDYDTLMKRQELIKTKTPSELASMSGLGDLPIPSKIENLMKGGKDTPSSNMDISSIKEMDFTVPKQLTMELAVTAVVEDEEVMRQHREVAQNNTVAELSKVLTISDFPIPDTIENLLKKKDQGNDTDTMKSSTLSLSAITSGKIIPESLRETKLITNIKVEKDQEKLAARQSLIKNQTPMQLGSIKNLQDLPIPSKLQNLHLPAAFNKSARYPTDSPDCTTYSPTAPPRQKSCNASIYESLPSSLRNEVVVRSRPITDEESKYRQELIRSKSPVELSQIGSLKDFPVPKTIERMFEKTDEPDADGKEPVDFIEKYSTLPPSLKTNLLVGVKTEDQELVQQRAETVKSKSVSELSEIRSMNDIPIPSTLTRLAKRDYAPVERKKMFKQQMKSQSTQSLSLQSTLPRSFREKQLLVSSKVEDPEILSVRKSIVESKSVAELSKVSSLADIPVPGFLSRLASRSLNKLHSLSTGHLNDPDQESKSGIYSTLPKSLNCELLVSKSVQDVSLLEERMQLINDKSTKELATMRSIKDFPVPDVVQRIYHKSMDRLQGNPTTDNTDGTGSEVSGGGGLFKMPAMLSQPCIVTTKIEDPQVLMERQQIQQQKSIHELSKIRNLNEFPVPGNVITLPDVPLPKLKNMLQLVARPPARAPRASPPGGESEQQSHLPGHAVDTDSQRDIEEDDYSNLEDSYEVIEKEELPARLVSESSPQVEVEPFGLATQIKGTPERSARSKKKKPEPRNRGRSQEDGSSVNSQVTTTSRPSAAAPSSMTEMSESFETPPPLPPKRSPHKSMSLDSQQSFEDADMAAGQGGAEGSPAPVKGVLTLEAMNGNIQVIKNETHTGMDGIQSRPLPAPPAPIRYGRNTSRESSTTNDHTLMEDSQKFQSARETLTMTNMTTTSHSQTLLATDDDDNTMADSIVDSLVSCTDTLICDDNEDDMDDDPYPSVNFESGLTEVKDTKTQGKRLEEGTQQLSQELMNHVESLRSTLDNMSNRLGARSRSRSSSRPRSISRTRQNLIQDKL